MMVNKKGIFMPVFVFLMFIVFSYTLFIFNAQRNEANVEFGDSYVRVLQLYNEGRSEEYYSETCARWALDNAIYRFFENGGVLDKCGQRWDFVSEDCNPNMEKIFSDYLYEELSLCSDVLFEIKNDRVQIDYGDIDYFEDINGVLINYSLNSSFEFDLGFEMDYFSLLREEVLECVENFKIEGCVMDVDISQNERLYVIKVPEEVLKRKLQILEDGKIVIKSPIFLFKIRLDSSSGGIMHDWIEL